MAARVNVQCITCSFAVTHGAGRGKNFCSADETKSNLDLMSERFCRDWKLGAMMQVRGRTVKRLVFPAGTIAVRENA